MPSKTNKPDARNKVLKNKRSGVQRGKIYELLVLGELMSGPHHGYLLREIISKTLGPSRHISWGVLYPLLYRFEEAGLIRPDIAAKPRPANEPGKHEQRNLFAITETGRTQFQALMAESLPFVAYDPDLFVGKLGYFDFISVDQQRAILQHHRSYLQTHDDYLRQTGGEIQVNTEIPALERRRILWVIDYRLSRIQSETQWVDAAMAKLSKNRRKLT